MRILQLTNKIPYPPKDGGAIATLNISRGLAQLGHEITILGMNTLKHYFNIKLIPEDITNLIDIREVVVDTKISAFAALKNLLFSDDPYNAERFFHDGFANALKKLLNEKSFDVIQLEGLYLGYYIDIIRAHSKAKISLRAHNIEHEIWERTASQEKLYWKKLYFRMLAVRIRRFEIRMLNKYDLLVPITERDASHYMSFGNKKPYLVVPSGFDTSLLVPKPDNINYPSVFFIGTLDWFPNQEGLVWFIEQVWPLVLQKHPDLKFHVAGRNAPQWITRLFNRNPNIDYMGEIEDAYQFITDNAVMVAPLFSGSGMRVKIIEGMALGKAIVTTTIGAEGIDVTPGKNIFVEDDAEGFCQQLDHLLNDRVLFNEVGKQANLFVGKNYDNHKISVSLADFYSKNL